jgi:uncharacterized membrane protein
MQASTPRVAGNTVVGLFADRSAAERGIKGLKDAGFSEEEIGVAMRDKQQQKDLTEGTGTQAAEGAAKGAVGGGVLGGLVGLLTGVGALAIPGIGPIIAGAGGLIGALVGMGVPEEDAKHFDRGFQEGAVLVTVLAGADGEEARDVIVACGGDLGPAYASRAPLTATSPGATSESWRGNERRYSDDASYTGPDRRLATR